MTFRIAGVRVVGASSSAIFHILTDLGMVYGKTLCGRETYSNWHVEEGDAATMQPRVNCKLCLRAWK